MSKTLQIGKLGEDMVAKFLQKHGCLITRRNYHSKYGEIDIVAEKGEYIFFVEVKTREENSPITPVGAVSKTKQRKIVLTAKDYLCKLRVNVNYRFDIAEVVYSIDENGQFHASLNYIRNAFNEEVLDNSVPF